MMSVLQEPHYVRCIKPNEIKSPSQFDDRRCRHQVMYLGLLENVRVRRAGFAFRSHYERFLARWAGLHLSTVSAILFSFNISLIFIWLSDFIWDILFQNIQSTNKWICTVKDKVLTKFWIATFCVYLYQSSYKCGCFIETQFILLKLPRLISIDKCKTKMNIQKNLS